MDRRRGNTHPTDSRASSRTTLLGIYLNDHLVGATSGVELARRIAKTHTGSETGRAMRRIAIEIADDRSALMDIMSALGIPVRRYKVYAGWAAEKAGRLKLNGRAFERSPLSDLLEFETLRLGVEGKAEVWRTLATLADTDERLDPERLDTLLTRAARQADTLEELRQATAARIFATA